MTTVAPRPRALTIAGSDSGGGAGIQADLKTFSALGVFGMTAITAVTVQNTLGVGYEASAPERSAEQIRAVATDIGVDAAKTGMLANAAIVEAVADGRRGAGGSRTWSWIPCSSPSTGTRCWPGRGRRARGDGCCRSRRSSRRTWPRPRRSSGLEVADARRHASGGRRDPRARAPRAVLVKGGHLDGRTEAADLFVDGRRTSDGSRRTGSTRRNTHGTGCTLSAAIAAHLAREATLGRVRRGRRS